MNTTKTKTSRKAESEVANMATIIKGSTKRGQNFIHSANCYKGETLRDVYSSFSKDKEDAYMECRKLYHEMKGTNFRIPSASRYYFTVAWDCLIEYENPVTGEITMEDAVYTDTGKGQYLILVDM